jgi:uncharacterized protein
MEALIDKTIDFVKAQLANAEGGHDWFHVERVYRNALLIAKNESCDLEVVLLAALLHDIADSKFHGGDERIGPKRAREFLEQQGVLQTTVDHVIVIIENMSFRSRHDAVFSSTELHIVRDADRLDAMGAIGIARAFNYGGFKGRAMFDPSIEPHVYQSKKEYTSSTAPTINHFYEKLLLLKDLMDTQTGKLLAFERHVFMETFLTQFYAEWHATTRVEPST